MTVATATPQQLAELSAYIVMMRAVASQLSKAMAQMNALSNSYNATITGIIGGAGTGTVVADDSGLNGIAPLTDTDVVNITFIFQSILTSWYDSAHQQLLTRACGPSNTQ
jgi:hypothetical protein